MWAMVMAAGGAKPVLCVKDRARIACTAKDFRAAVDTPTAALDFASDRVPEANIEALLAFHAKTLRDLHLHGDQGATFATILDRESRPPVVGPLRIHTLYYGGHFGRAMRYASRSGADPIVVVERLASHAFVREVVVSSTFSLHKGFDPKPALLRLTDIPKVRCAGSLDVAAASIDPCIPFDAILTWPWDNITLDVDANAVPVALRLLNESVDTTTVQLTLSDTVPSPSASELVASLARKRSLRHTLR